MGKDLNVSRLCDAYGALLTEHRLDIVRSYYDYDLSLAEIAENFGITRQAALCAIKQAEAKLRDYEAKIGLVARSDRLKSELNGLAGEIEVDPQGAKSTIGRIMDEL